VSGRITLRAIIDAVRAGFRTMYEGTTQRDIPGMENKDVNGPAGDRSNTPRFPTVVACFASSS
jgi:hypothetical protein